MSTLYSLTHARLEREEQHLLRACRSQGSDHLALRAPVTAKLAATPEQLARSRHRLEATGLRVSAMVFVIGHPAMGRSYDATGQRPRPARHSVLEGDVDRPLLPASWQHAVNEYGNPVYCCACANERWLADNQRIAADLAAILDQVWYDDEFHLDGDQGAGAPHTSTAVCYCDACLARLSARLGRTLTRDQLMAEPDLHAADEEGGVAMSGTFEPDGFLLRRALGLVTGLAYGHGDLDVMLVHHRRADRDVLMVVNLAGQTRRVQVHRPPYRPTLAEWQGGATESHLGLGPHEIRPLQAC